MKRIILKQKEENLQINICGYLRRYYPNVIFTCDLGSGMKLTIGQAVKAQKMRSSRGLPDLMIFQPKGNYYHGMVLELKRQGTQIYLKDGKTLVADAHIREQHDILKKFRERGYYAEMVCGLEDALRHINHYLKQ